MTPEEFVRKHPTWTVQVTVEAWCSQDPRPRVTAEALRRDDDHDPFPLRSVTGRSVEEAVRVLNLFELDAVIARLEAEARRAELERLEREERERGSS